MSQAFSLKAPIKKTIWGARGNYSAEWNTGQDSLQQMSQFEWQIDIHQIQVKEAIRNKGDLSLIHAWYDLVRVYYRRLQACLWHKTNEEINQEWIEIVKLYDEWAYKNRYQIPILLINKLDNFIANLYKIKQAINMGIPMKKEYTTTERLNKAIR